MTVALDPAALVAFLLALSRATAWLTIAPPFNTRMIPIPVKIGFSAALALAVTPKVAASLGPTQLDTAQMIGAVVLQVVAGAGLGFIALVLFSSVSAGGSLIDLFGGFAVAQAYDPFLNNQASVFGRFYQLLATTLLFAIGGHLVLVKGFMTSFDALPLRGPNLASLGSVLVNDVGLFFLAAVEIAAPLLAALFLAQVVLGMLARAAPHLNIFALSFPFTILLTLTLAGLALPLVSQAVNSIVHNIFHSTSLLR